MQLVTASYGTIDNKHMDENFLKVAKQAAIEAGKIIQKYSGEVHNIKVKYGDSSDFVTEADTEAEEAIVSLISKNFPEHNIVAEENTKIEQGSEYSWVIDPLDGTFSFSRGIPYFAVSIGLLHNNQPILGVINHIPFDDLYSAQKGKGAYLNDKLIHVNNSGDVSKAAVGLGFGHRAKRKEKMELYVNKLVTEVGYPYGLGSAAVQMAYVATGQLDLHINDAWIWDLAAGVVIIEEAGGKVTDLDGKDVDWTKDRIALVASNGLIHDQILEVLR